MNLERTINGLTRHSARQLGQVYFTLAESLDLLDEHDKDRAAVSKELTKLSIDASSLRQENAELKRRIRDMEDGGKMPERSVKGALDSIRLATERISAVFPIDINIDIVIDPEQDGNIDQCDDTPLPELDGHSPNEVREMQANAAQKVAQAYGDDQKPHKIPQALYPVRLAKLADAAVAMDASTAAMQQVSDAARDCTSSVKVGDIVRITPRADALQTMSISAKTWRDLEGKDLHVSTIEGADAMVSESEMWIPKSELHIVSSGEDGAGV